MANEIPEDSTFEEDVQAILTTDSVVGESPGFTGAVSAKINTVFKTIVDRTRWLKDAVENVDVTVPNATTTTRGIAELATQSEAQTATDTTRIMSPRRVWDLIVNRIASTSQGRGGSNNDRIITPSRMLDALRNGSPFQSSTSRRGAVELATTDEAEAGTDTERAVTPEGLRSFFFNADW